MHIFDDEGNAGGGGDAELNSAAISVGEVGDGEVEG